MRGYADILSGYLPELERCVVRLRVLHIVLFIFYIECLKNRIIYTVRTSLKLDSNDENYGRGRKKFEGLRDCVAYLVKIGAFSKSEETELLSMVDYRNRIAHEVDTIFFDISPNRKARLSFLLNQNSAESFDEKSLVKIRALAEKLYNIGPNYGLIFAIDLRDEYFKSIEQLLKEDIKRLKGRIDRLSNKRLELVKILNEEIEEIHRYFKGDRHPFHIKNKNSVGRLTQKGVEICNKMFENGYSDMAIAHAMRLSLSAIQRRKAAWIKLNS